MNCMVPNRYFKEFEGMQSASLKLLLYINYVNCVVTRVYLHNYIIAI